MFYTIADDLIFYQLLSFVRKYKNFELKLRDYFYSRTDGIYPEFIVVINRGKKNGKKEIKKKKFCYLTCSNYS